jgi:hypothetical protein
VWQSRRHLLLNFSSNNSSICETQSVSFTDLSTNNPTSWSWSFPGGNPSSSTAQNPTVTYNTPGNYSVTLIATNANGSNTETKTNFIQVNTAPTATASANTPICDGQSIQLTANTVSGATYSWTGPGSYSSSDQNPTRTNATSAMSGLYQLSISLGGCTSTASVNIVVNNTPNANITGNSPVCIGDNINLSVALTSGATYNWTGPNGFTANTASVVVPNASSINAGMYAVSVSTNACTGQSNTMINVNSIPLPNISLSNDTLFVTPSSGYSIQWMLNGNPIPGANSEWYVPLQDGIYSALITDANNCSENSQDFVYSISSLNQITNGFSILAYPNPGDGIVNLQFSTDQNFDAILQMFDAKGSIVHSEIVSIPSGLQTHILNVGHLAAGLYYIRFIGNIDNKGIRYIKW